MARVALACVLSLLLVCESARATPTWLPAADLSATGQTAEFPQVVVDPQGDATAVWQRYNGAEFIIQAATRPAGGVWQRPVDLSVAGRNAANPQVAVDPQGDVTAVWARSNGTNTIVQAATRPTGGVWQPSVDLSVAGQNAAAPGLAVDAQGNAVAVWDRYDGADFIVQAADRQAANGVWQTPVDLSAAGQNAANPRVAVDPQGDVTAVWDRSNGTNTIVQAATRPAVGAWQSPVDLSAAGQDAAKPQVALDAQGNSIAVWYRYDGTDFVVQAAGRQGPIGVWQAPVDLSAAGQDAGGQQVTFDARGNATAIWARYNGTDFIIQAAVHPAGATWQTPADLSATGQDAQSPEVGVDARGKAVAVWYRYNGTAFVIQAAVQLEGGMWQAPVDLSSAGQQALYPGVSLDAQGNATAIWQRLNAASNYIVQASGYDAAGPVLRGLSIPASGAAGLPVSLAVSPLDVWSPIASTLWSFGDGQSATGMRVSHTYAKPGNYAITLGSADTLANATSATANITIVPATTIPPRAPALTHVHQTHRSWRESTRRSALSRKPKRMAPVGTTFGFTLNEAARVSLVFSQTMIGHRVSGHCRTSSKHNRRGLRCRRAVIRGTLAYTTTSGRHQLAFEGRIGKQQLPLGAYTLTIVAANVTTRARSRPRTLQFTILR